MRGMLILKTIWGVYVHECMYIYIYIAFYVNKGVKERFLERCLDEIGRRHFTLYGVQAFYKTSQSIKNQFSGASFCKRA